MVRHSVIVILTVQCTRVLQQYFITRPSPAVHLLAVIGNVVPNITSRARSTVLLFVLLCICIIIAVLTNLFLYDVSIIFSTEFSFIFCVN